MNPQDAAFFSAALALLDELPCLPPGASEEKLDLLLGGCADPPIGPPSGEAQGDAAAATAGDASACVPSTQQSPSRPRLAPLLPKPVTSGHDGAELPATIESRRRTRPRNYNPNKARDERKREVDQLRLKVAALQRQLRVLSDRPVGLNMLTGSLSSGKDAASALPRVWEDLCHLQLQRRMAAEGENVRLRRALTAQLQVSRRMQRLLHRSTTFDSPSLVRYGDDCMALCGSSCSPR
jgi:hypothetical protein